MHADQNAVAARAITEALAAATPDTTQPAGAGDVVSKASTSGAGWLDLSPVQLRLRPW